MKYTESASPKHKPLQGDARALHNSASLRSPHVLPCRTRNRQLGMTESTYVEEYWLGIWARRRLAPAPLRRGLDTARGFDLDLAETARSLGLATARRHSPFVRSINRTSVRPAQLVARTPFRTPGSASQPGSVCRLSRLQPALAGRSNSCRSADEHQLRRARQLPCRSLTWTRLWRRRRQLLRGATRAPCERSVEWPAPEALGVFSTRADAGPAATVRREPLLNSYEDRCG